MTDTAWLTARELWEALLRGHGVGYASSARRAIIRRCADGLLRAKATHFKNNNEWKEGVLVPAEFFGTADLSRSEIDWATGDFTLRLSNRYRERTAPVEIRGLTFSATDAQAMGAIVNNVPEMLAPSAHTGLPGRPTPVHLIVAEMHRRAETKSLQPTLASEARSLLAWYDGEATFSQLPSISLKTIQNRIRDDFRKSTVQK